jgi:hypothetical protein
MFKKFASLALVLMSSNLVAMKGQLQAKPIMQTQQQIQLLHQWQEQANKQSKVVKYCLACGRCATCACMCCTNIFAGWFLFNMVRVISEDLQLYQ